jgi:SAM-dependent methyltransferase
VNLERLRVWIEEARRCDLPDAAVLEAFHILGPQCRFLKTLPRAASVLDVGAGEGSAQIYRHWPAPSRPDLTMFAYAAVQGAMFDQYHACEIGRWPEAAPDFGGRRFDAIFAANFIEHIDGPTAFIRWAAERLTTRGRIYLEWPSEAALTLPSASTLRDIGLDVMTGSYFDDATHQHELPSADLVHDALRTAGLCIEATGVARVPFFEDHMLAMGLEARDTVCQTLAYWSFTAWSRFVVARRGAPTWRSA